jgi:hypothetical protein
VALFIWTALDSRAPLTNALCRPPVCLGLQTSYQLFCDERLPALKADNPKVLPRGLCCVVSSRLPAPC